MKKFIITYVIFSVVVLVLVYLVTLIQETQKRSLELFYEFADAAVLNRDFDDFVKYQSIGFQQTDYFDLPLYDVFIYHVITQTDDNYAMQFIIFVLPIEDIDHASEIKDANDRTRLSLIDGDSKARIYDTALDSDYENVAISYGIQRIGFYYYAIDLDATKQLSMTLYDYHGHIMLETDVTFEMVSYNGNQMPEGFYEGFTTQQVDELRDMRVHLVRPMLTNITLYLIVDILTGTLFYWFLKKKQL